MKVFDGFVLKTIADTNIVVPIGENTVNFNAIVSLNESGAFLWKLLESEQTEEDLVSAMLKEYAVDEKTVREDIKAFINKLSEANLLVC